jgi:HCOMODA/2-hydroxy-3-carboxy-muconic semialdehyde decarboxylase
MWDSQQQTPESRRQKNTREETSVANILAEARRELALANRIVANEGVIDAFGHVSMRHPDNPGRYFLSRSRAPELVTPEDFIEYDLDSRPVREPTVTQYSERVIHGEIYKARPEVNSVCHHHCQAFMPLLATGTDYVPVFHLGAVGGIKPPFWDQHDEFGDTNMLVIKPEEGASLARALGAHWMVLMKRHGVTVAGTSVKDCVFRSVYSARNAEYQVRALAIGDNIASLSPGEAELAGAISAKTTGLTRSWEYWSMRVAKSGGGVPAAKTASPARAKSKTAARLKVKKKGAVRRR